MSSHDASARCKAPRGKKATNASVKPGDLVYVKNEGTKHTARHRYIVSSCHEGYAMIKKLVGSQFRTKEYKVKLSEIFLVPCQMELLRRNFKIPDPYASASSSDDSDDQSVHVSTHDNGHIPQAVEPPVVDPVDHPPDGDDDRDLHEPLDPRPVPLDSPVDNLSDDSSQSSEDSDTVDIEQKRPSRCHKPPKWMQSDEWDLQS